jgi:hypothetical protein
MTRAAVARLAFRAMRNGSDRSACDVVQSLAMPVVSFRSALMIQK